MFGSTEVSKLTGVPLPTVIRWDREKLLRPSERKPRGSQTTRRYSVRDVIAMGVLDTLRKMGFGQPQLGQIARMIQDDKKTDLEHGHVVAVDVDDEHISYSLVDDRSPDYAKITTGDVLFDLSLAKYVEGTIAKLREMGFELQVDVMN